MTGIARKTRCLHYNAGMAKMRAAGWCLGFLGTAIGWAQPDYPSALWNAAYSGNYATSNRPTTYPITDVVIHIMEGTYNGSISWFQNPSSHVSAHYLIRSSDGQITQMVREKDLAYHAGITFYNQQAVGIEHEATSTNPAWYTDAMYWSSARLTRYLVNKYSIPVNRTHILGHNETGRATICPGTIWDWTKYMSLVQINATAGSHTFPANLNAGSSSSVTVRMNNTGVDTWLSSGTDVVYLDTYPAGRVSAFANSWINTTRPAAVFLSAAGGTVGEFRFNITAPTSNGYYEETFQLNRASVGRFGPIITLGITVGQGDRVIDNVDAGFSTNGLWIVGGTAAGRYGADYKYANVGKKTNAEAYWDGNLGSEGLYDVYAWWPQGTNRGTQVIYEVDDVVEGKVVKTFNQQTLGGQWNLIGRARMAPGRDTIKMTPYNRSPEAGQVAIADAVRLVGPL